MILDRVDFVEDFSLGESTTAVLDGDFEGLSLNASGVMCLALKAPGEHQAQLIEIKDITRIEACGLILSPGAYSTDAKRADEIKMFLNAVLIFAEAEKGDQPLSRFLQRRIIN